MSTKLSSGAIIPSGLLSHNTEETAIAAFNRSYKNTGIKAGLIQKSYAPTDPENKNHLCTEYDVLTIEQMENKGTTSILYKHCLSTQGFGSIADYFEYTLRPLTKQDSKGFPTFSNQDGAIVLIQCLNNIGDKAVVIGTLIHPDRSTNVTSNAPQMFGEYNGVSIQINEDGSCSLTFKGATDSQGNAVDPSQGNTVFQIQKDGSFQFTNSAVTITGAKSGSLIVNTSADTNINVGGACTITSSGKTTVTASEVDVQGSTGEVLTTKTDMVVDTIFGEPTVGVPTFKAG